MFGSTCGWCDFGGETCVGGSTTGAGGVTLSVLHTAGAVEYCGSVQFEPALVKVIPKKYAHFLERPMEAFEKAVDQHGDKIAEGSFDAVATDPRVVEAYLGLRRAQTK